MFAGQAKNIGQAAMRGKQVAGQVAKRIPGPVRNHPYRSAALGMAIAGGVASGRRRSGLDKVQGRPTGMYGY
jgi:hypothetical protein